MAESYFEFLTEQPGLPAVTFDPLRELKRLRRTLELRLQQHSRCQKEPDVISFQRDSAQMDALMQKVESMKKALTVLCRSRYRKRLLRGSIHRFPRREWKKRSVPLQAVRCADVPQERVSHVIMLETLNAGLSALGIIGIIFGALSFLRGMESDLSLGMSVCIAGAIMVSIGLGGRFLAPQ